MITRIGMLIAVAFSMAASACALDDSTVPDRDEETTEPQALVVDRAVAAQDQAVAGAAPTTWLTNCDGRQEDFRVAANNAAEHRWQQTPGGAWSGWASLGGTLLYGKLTAFLNGDCKIEVFGTGTNHAVWTIWQSSPSSGPWKGWVSLGGTLIGAPAAVHTSTGLHGVCAVGTDNQVWCNRHTQPFGSPWTGWFLN